MLAAAAWLTAGDGRAPTHRRACASNPTARTTPALAMEALLSIQQPRVASCLFGHVMQARLRDASKTPVAVKVFDAALAKRRVTAAGIPVAEDADMELTVLRAAAAKPHPHLMGMHPCASGLAACNMGVEEAAAAGKKLLAILPWCGDGDLMSLLQNKGGGLKPDTARRHFVGVAGAVSHLHAIGFVHRDISLENIMVARDPSAPDGVRVLLGDFGGAGPVGRFPMPHVRPGKVGFVCPELYHRHTGGYSGVAADVYSLGVVLFCLLAGCMPYNAPRMDDQCFALIRAGHMRELVHAWGLDAQFSGGALDLVSQMMAIDPAERPTMAEVLAHPWCTRGRAKAASGPGAGTVEVAAALAPAGAPPSATASAEAMAPVVATLELEAAAADATRGSRSDEDVDMGWAPTVSAAHAHGPDDATVRSPACTEAEMARVHCGHQTAAAV